MQNTDSYNTNNKKGVVSLSLRDEVEKYLYHWKWFLLSLAVLLGTAYIHLRYSTNIYSARLSIMIKDNLKSGISEELKVFGDLGIVGNESSNNPDNEIEILKSRKIIGRVVDSLNLTVLYKQKGKIKDSYIYDYSPIRASLVSKDVTQTKKSITIKLSDFNDKSYSYSILNSEEQVYSKRNFNEILRTEAGNFNIEYKSIDTKLIDINELTDGNIEITITDRDATISRYISRLEIEAANDFSSVLFLTLNSPVKRKAEDFLNELVKQYNLDAIHDKNKIHIKTINFIDDRLEIVGKDLSKVQDNIKEFKTKSGFVDLPSEGSLFLNKLLESNSKIIEIQTELKFANTIKKSINDVDNLYEALPNNITFSNSSASNLVAEYNSLILTRLKTIVDAGNKNPSLIDLDLRIKTIKEALSKTLSNHTSSLELKLMALNKEQIKFSNKKSMIPVFERSFIDIIRQQEITSNLYTYLLKKKEEISISLAVTVPNAKIIDVAYGNDFPISPKKPVVYLIALFLALAIPFSIIYLYNLLDNKFYSKTDLAEFLTAPIIGEIPQFKGKKKILTGEEIRTKVSESFKILKASLEFYMPKTKDKGKCMFITSTISGEGKTIISINLAITIALTGKKVLLLGMDLRAPKVTEYFGTPDMKGVTNFIVDDKIKLDDLKFSRPESSNLKVISSGPVPPNPSELLMSKRVDEIFTKVKNEYDYIIVDTSPIYLVADTLLFSKNADMVLYICRANYLDKRMLSVVNDAYEENKLNNIKAVLNSSSFSKNYGYGGYGGYGYNYAYLEDKKPWYKK